MPKLNKETNNVISLNKLHTSLTTLCIDATTPVLNQAAIAKVSEKLPELSAKANAFDRNNSQTTLKMMSLTMMNGQSPMRMLRQILAEVEKRKLALAEAQATHAENLEEIDELYKAKQTPAVEAKIRHKKIMLATMESKINGAMKDIAALADAYDSIKEKHSIDEWDESSFEAEEKRHHVRRGFELLYRNLIEVGRAKDGTIEYLQQYGVHVQVALAETMGYIDYINQAVAAGEFVSASNMEDFFDQMTDKYYHLADEACERAFGNANITNENYMLTKE